MTPVEPEAPDDSAHLLVEEHDEADVDRRIEQEIAGVGQGRERNVRLPVEPPRVVDVAGRPRRDRDARPRSTPSGRRGRGRTRSSSAPRGRGSRRRGSLLSMCASQAPPSPNSVCSVSTTNAATPSVKGALRRTWRTTGRTSVYIVKGAKALIAPEAHADRVIFGPIPLTGEGRDPPAATSMSRMKRLLIPVAATLAVTASLAGPRTRGQRQIPPGHGGVARLPSRSRSPVAAASRPRATSDCTLRRWRTSRSEIACARSASKRRHGGSWS